MATEKQIAFITTLMQEREHNIAEDVDLTTLSGGYASNLIEALLASPRKSQKAVEEGFYMVEGAVYRVVRSKSSGNPYAKRLKIHAGSGAWEYVPGGMARLVNAEKLTVDVAKKMGAHYGVCVVCGRTLTNPESVDAGIGPVCGGKL